MILCVEDEANIRDLVVYTLETTGMEARGFEDGPAFFKALAENLPELVLLDIMLPGEDGMSILKKLKAAPETRHIPVIMLGLDSGADDYVTTPFGMMELVSRIKAVLRRSGVKTEEAEELVVGQIRLNKKKHEVYAAGVDVTLTLKEFELLRMLMENRNIVLTAVRKK